MDIEPQLIVEALAQAGMKSELRSAIFEALRRESVLASDPEAFNSMVRWPIIRTLLARSGYHRVALANGLKFDLKIDSRIEQAALLSPNETLDHIWEPQTTRLLVMLAQGAEHVIVGGAYIGDHVLPIAQASQASGKSCTVHAFEPFEASHSNLLHHLQLNHILNVRAHRLALWDRSKVPLNLSGLPALGSTEEVASTGPSTTHVEPITSTIESITIDDYVSSLGLSHVGLIMLDTEGAEEKALLGAKDLLSQPRGSAPNLIFEIHRNFVDWSEGLCETSIVKFLQSHDYDIYAIRDFHDNYSMNGKPIEIIPIDRTYVDGPPHGFNVMATKDPHILAHLDLKTVLDVSPKLLLNSNPKLHHPVDGL